MTIEQGFVSMFGEITAGAIVTFVVILVQSLKGVLAWSDKKCILYALLFSFLPTMGANILIGLAAMMKAPTEGEAAIIMGWAIFKGFYYTVFVWTSATGVYHLGVKPAIEKARSILVNN